MSQVNRKKSAVNFQFTMSDTPEVTLADVSVKVYNPVVKVRYNEVAPFQSVGLAFAALPPLSSRENVSIHTLDYYPEENRPNVGVEEFKTSLSFDTKVGKFLLTDIFIKKGTGRDIPLYYQHTVPITTDLFIQSGADIVILDKAFNVVDPNNYHVWEGTNDWYVFHNYKHEYDTATGDYQAYYVSYQLWDSTSNTQREYVELLRPTPRFREAEDGDYDPDTLLLPDDVPLYEIQDNPSQGDFTIFNRYDIADESPMNDFYGSPAPYVYAYRQEQIHEIGPLYPKDLLLENAWFPVLTNGTFYVGIKKYTIVEFGQQPFIPYEPYKRNIYEEGILLERNLLKTQNQNLFVEPLSGFHLEILIFDREENIKWAISTDTSKEYFVDAVGEVTPLPYDHDGILSSNYEDGLIQVSYTLVELDDIILVNYYYEETDFEYVQTNLNPLFNEDVANKSVVLFLKPYDISGGAVPTVTCYDLLLDEEDNIEDSNAVPGSTTVSEPGNTSNGTLLVDRGYTGDADRTMYVRIVQENSVEGDITDATYQIRQGISGSWTTETAMIEGWVSLTSGASIQFVAADRGQDFVAGDIWTIALESNDTGLTDLIFGMSFQEFLSTYCLPNESSVYAFLVVAHYSVGSNRRLEDIYVVDTRVRGGGIEEDQIAEAKLVYPEINWMFDVGHYDGKPFPGAAAVLIDIPANLLEINGGIMARKEVDSIVKHHLSFGVYPVVRFYCTNTGLVSHETVPDEHDRVWNWVVPEGLKCPTPDGEIVCVEEFWTTTTTSTSTSTTSSSTSSSTTTTTAPP